MAEQGVAFGLHIGAALVQRPELIVVLQVVAVLGEVVGPGNPVQGACFILPNQLKFLGKLVRFAGLQVVDHHLGGAVELQVAEVLHVSIGRDGLEGEPVIEVPAPTCGYAEQVLLRIQVVQGVAVEGVALGAGRAGDIGCSTSAVGVAGGDAQPGRMGVEAVRHGGLPRPGHVRRQRKLGGVALPEQLGSGADAVLITAFIPGENLFAHAVALFALHAGPHRRTLAEGQFPRRQDVEAAIVADGQLHFAAVLHARLAADHVHRAADGVLAEQSALRPAQDLHPFKIEQVQGGPLVAPDIHPVDVQAHSGVGGDHVVGLADAAQKHGPRF